MIRYIITAKIEIVRYVDSSSASITHAIKDIYFQNKDEKDIVFLTQFESLAKRFKSSKEANDFIGDTKGVYYFNKVHNPCLFLRDIEIKKIIKDE